MKNYNYYEEMKKDVKEYLEENKNYLESNDYNYLYDIMFLEDSITGNASGSYYCNAWKAEEVLSHNLDLLKEALEEFGDDFNNALERGAEYCDVTIRCYLLGQVLNDVLEEEEL